MPVRNQVNNKKAKRKSRKYANDLCTRVYCMCVCYVLLRMCAVYVHARAYEGREL